MKEIKNTEKNVKNTLAAAALSDDQLNEVSGGIINPNVAQTRSTASKNSDYDFVPISKKHSKY